MGEELSLHEEKAMFWAKQALLVVSDFHLGKSEHFRKNGIPMPGNIIDSEFDRVDKLIEHYKPEEVLFLGDLFHSVYNQSWERVIEFIQPYESVTFSLVEGNHDILEKSEYTRAGIHFHGVIYEKGPFLFAHDHIDNLPNELYGVYGHVHPGVSLQGRGRQKMTLPCFCLREDHLLMPAFGAFTGLARVKPVDSDRFYAIADGRVFAVR